MAVNPEYKRVIDKMLRAKDPATMKRLITGRKAMVASVEDQQYAIDRLSLKVLAQWEELDQWDHQTRQ
jgi:hypothetical protein